MSTPRISARFLQSFLPRDQVRALQQAAAVVTASAANTYTSISNDSGATWSPVPVAADLTFVFYRGAFTISTVVVTGTRDNVTGYNTLTSVVTGESITVTYTNNGTQIAAAVMVHNESMAQTAALFQSLKDGTALGSYSGGGGK